jgi:hypothetical protein
MKRIILIVLFGLSCSAVCKPGFKGGNWVGNGGDSMAMAIYSRIRELYVAYKNLSAECAQTLPVSRLEFAEILADLDVTTSPEPLYIEVNKRRVFKEAINYPEQVTIDIYRTAYRESLNRDQLLLHEIMGLKYKEDPGGEVSEYFAGVLNGKACKQAVAEQKPRPSQQDQPKPSQPLPVQSQTADLAIGEIPVFSDMDRKGVLYFLVSGRSKIFRYSVREGKYLPPLMTTEVPITIGVSPEGDRVYVAYAERRITFFEMAKGLEEKPFTIASLAKTNSWDDDDARKFEKSQIGQLFVLNGTVAVIPTGYNWMNWAFYSKAGKRVSQTGWKSPVVAIAPDFAGKGLYQITGWSPQTLEYTPFRIAPNSYRDEMRWPYHGDFETSGPIAVSPLHIAIGSGYIVDTKKMEVVKKIGEKFDRATWNGAHLFTSLGKKSGFNIRAMTAPRFDVTFEKNYELGALISMHSFDQTVVAVWVDAVGNVKIDTIQ